MPWRTAILAAAIAWASAAPGADRAPGKLFLDLVGFLIAADECRLTLSADQREALKGAGDRVRRAVDLPDEQVVWTIAKAREDAKRVDCPRFQEVFAAQLEALLAEAGRVR